jgi:hypothetical protein
MTIKQKGSREAEVNIACNSYGHYKLIQNASAKLNILLRLSVHVACASHNNYVRRFRKMKTRNQKCKLSLTMARGSGSFYDDKCTMVGIATVCIFVSFPASAFFGFRQYLAAYGKIFTFNKKNHCQIYTTSFLCLKTVR